MKLQPKLFALAFVAMSALMVAASQQARPQDLVTKEVLIGPVQLPAHSHPPHKGGFAPEGLSGEATPWFFTSQLPLVDLKFDTDMSLVEFRPQVVDGHGKPLPGSLLCHTAIVMVNPSSALGTPTPSAIVGSGGELSEVVIPQPYGIILPRAMRFQLMSMFRNPTPVDYQDVYLKVQMRLRPLVSGATPPISSAQVTWVSVADGDGVYMVPPGKDVRTKRFTFPSEGKVVYIMGHQHAPFGESFVLENLATGKPVWQAKADKTFNGLAIQFPPWSAEQAFDVIPSQEYQLTVTYNNTSIQPTDAMGVIGVFMVPHTPPKSDAAQPQR